MGTTDCAGGLPRGSSFTAVIRPRRPRRPPGVYTLRSFLNPNPAAGPHSMLLSSIALLPALCLPTQDEFSWPQWDGPNRTGVSAETDWASEGKEEHLWEAELGLGYSTVAVADGRVFTMGYDKDQGLDVIWAFDAKSGEELWSHAYPSAIWDRAHEGGTVNTPSIDGKVVYTLNREGNLFCFEADSGEIVWHTDLMEEGNDNDLTYPTWGFSASPLVLENELLLNCGRMLSIEKKTGKVLWRSKEYGHAYGTPIAFEFEGAPVLAALNGNGVAVISRKDGSEVFFYEFNGKNRGVNAATPVLVDGEALFVSSGTIPAGALLAMDSEEKELIPVWENREMVNSFSGCVQMDGHLFGFDQNVLKCIDLSGETRWEQRGIGNGAVVGAGDRVLAMTADGELIVFKADADSYGELSRTKLFEAGRYWTKPVIANGIIYCRSSKGQLVARDHRPSKN